MVFCEDRVPTRKKNMNSMMKLDWSIQGQSRSKLAVDFIFFVGFNSLLRKPITNVELKEYGNRR